jgi:hypothetical protein
MRAVEIFGPVSSYFLMIGVLIQMLADWNSHFSKHILEHCKVYVKNDGVMPPGHDDNGLRSLIVRAWSCVQVEAEKAAFSWLPSLVTQGEIGKGVAAHLKQVTCHLWESVLARMRMIDSHGKAIGGSASEFAKGFGWTYEMDVVFGPGEHMPDALRMPKIYAYMKDMVDRGISLRHQTAHTVGTDQIDPRPSTGRQRTRSERLHDRGVGDPPGSKIGRAEPLRPTPMDSLFVLIVFENVRHFKK